MATKRKTKRFADGGMSDEDVASFAGTPENESNAGMAESENESRGEAILKGMRDKPAASIATKEQLAKSGMNLRDYMNKQQGLTRRGGSAPAEDEVTKYAEKKTAARQASAGPSRVEIAKTELMSAKPSREDTQKGLEIISGGGAGAALKGVAALARKLAAAKAAQGVEKFAEYSTPILEGGRKMLPGMQKMLGMKKGGAVKKSATSSASRRGDGIASKGKTKGRMV